MTLTNNKKLSIAVLLTSTIIAIGIVPVFAHNPPYKDTHWFSKGDPNICFLDSELQNVKINRHLNTAQPNQPYSNPVPFIKTEVNDARENLNRAVSALNMGNDGTDCNTAPNIIVGARDLPIGVMGEVSNNVRYNDKSYKFSTFDFDTGYNYQVESNACDWGHDKDLEWISNHELGHALSLDHHISLWDHSMMKDTCSSKYSSPTTRDIAALKVRYT